MGYTTLDDFLSDLPALTAAYRQKLKGQTITAVLETSEGRRLLLSLKDGVLTIGDPTNQKAQCIVKADEQTLLDMINGRLNPMKALLFRKVTIEGDASVLLALLKLL